MNHYRVHFEPMDIEANDVNDVEIKLGWIMQCEGKWISCYQSIEY